MAKLIGAKGGTPAPKGGGSIVSTTRNSSVMKTSKSDLNKDKAGMNIAHASTPTKASSPGSGGSKGGMPSTKSTHSGTTNAGDAGAGLGGSRSLGCIYGNK
jgi:hypothetical protein